MKLKIITACCLLLTLGMTAALAQPAGKSSHEWRKYKTMSDVEDFESVEKDDKVGFVCLQCHTMSELDDRSKGGMMTYCREGSEVMCPSCHKKYRTVIYGQPGGKGAMHRKMMYVNEEGVQCAFMSKMKAQDEE